MMVVAALAAFALPTLALADPGGRDRDEHRNAQQWDNRDERRDERRDDRRDERRDEHRDDRHDNHWDNHHWDNRPYDRWSQAPRSYAPPPLVYGYSYGAPRYGNGYSHWQRGQYVSPRYRSYVIYDYGNYRLRPPPHGYRWVRADNDYLLVAIATGLIFDVIINDR
jgi:Ni/Co efflux regulator RcnB